MKFVDRIEETRRLKTVLSRDKAVVVVYGRRRLGKSELIKRTLTDDDIYFLADRSEGRRQRELLSKVVAQHVPDFDKVEYPDWETLFRAINYRVQQHITVCLDEFPYMVELSSELPSVLQKLIDEKSLRYNLIFCGSSQTMMYGTFLDSNAPLYGRASAIIKLTPIKIPFLQEALDIADPIRVIEEYAVWGGVPRYWELREPEQTLEGSLWNNIFSVNGTLYEEPAKLLMDDVKDIVKTSTLMSYVGSGANRLSEIASRAGEPATNLSRPLKKLVDLGFLEREVPFGVNEKSSKKSLYKIADPFTSFYYQFVVSNRSFIELGRKKPIEQALGSHFGKYVSMQWEKLCRDAITGNEYKGIIYGQAHRWWGSVLNESGKPEQIEIDVVAESIDKKTLLVGECKWTTEKNASQLTDELVRKANLLPFSKDYKEIIPVLFLKTRPENDADNVILPDNILDMF